MLAKPFQSGLGNNPPRDDPSEGKKIRKDVDIKLHIL